jgi:uncharacterized protein (TIGR02217 family)
MFINEELDICPGLGWDGGPEFSTRMATTKASTERRNAQNIEVRHSYTLPIANIPNAAYLKRLKQSFMACRGMLHSFKIKDYSDYEATNEAFGIGDGTKKIFQLRLDSTWGPATYTRLITKPQPDIVILVNGAAQAHSLDPLTGLITFTDAPPPAAIITWSGEFRVPVRFNSDILNMSIDNIFRDDGFAMNGSVTLIEVFKE